jgi:hypothetical protein
MQKSTKQTSEQLHEQLKIKLLLWSPVAAGQLIEQE